jgi:hypothetical protein
VGDNGNGNGIGASSKLEAGLDLVRRGFSVIPLVPNSKEPLIAAWPYAATRDEKKIHEWAQEFPGCNWGISMDGYATADIDPRNGGEDSLVALKEIFKDSKNHTLVAKTAGGGQHVIYRLPDRVRLKNGKDVFGKGIDLKTGAGAYLVAPGSVIKDNPKHPHCDGEYKWFRDRPIAGMPQELIELAGQARTSQRSSAAGKRLVEEDDEAVDRASKWLRDKAPEAEQGNRDNTAFYVAAKLYDFGVSKQTNHELMFEWNETKCSPPLELEEIERIVDSASRNRSMPIGYDHPKNSDGFDSVEIDESKKPQIPADRDHFETEKRSKLFYLTLAESRAKICEPRPKHLIEGLIPAGAMVVTYGESGEGKSFHVMDRYMHLVGGKPWQGRKVTPGAVVWVAAELSEDLYERIEAARQHVGVDESAPFLAVPCPVDLLRPAGDTKALIELVKQIKRDKDVKVVAVVIDTLSRALAGGNENAPDDMGTLVKHLDHIRYECCRTVEAIHHCGKDTARGARGHSLLRAATDTEIEVGGGRIRVTKQRTMAGGDNWEFRLRTRRVGIRHDGSDAISCYVETRAKGKGSQLWRQELTKTEQELFNALKEIAPAHPQGFGWEVAAVILSADKSNKNDDVGPTKPPARSTVVGHLTTLVGKGWLKRNKANQYLIALSADVGGLSEPTKAD